MPDYHPLQSKIGPARLWINTYQGGISAIGVCNAEGQTFRVNGVAFNIRMFFGCYDGVWSALRNSHGREEYHNLDMKKDGAPYGKDAASDSARAKAKDALTEAVNQWVKENPGKMAGRLLEHLRAEAEAAKAAVDKKLDELEEARVKCVEAQEALARAEKAAGQ